MRQRLYARARELLVWVGAGALVGLFWIKLEELLDRVGALYEDARKYRCNHPTDVVVSMPLGMKRCRRCGEVDPTPPPSLGDEPEAGVES